MFCSASLRPLNNLRHCLDLYASCILLHDDIYDVTGSIARYRFCCASDGPFQCSVLHSSTMRFYVSCEGLVHVHVSCFQFSPYLFSCGVAKPFRISVNCSNAGT